MLVLPQVRLPDWRNQRSKLLVDFAISENFQTTDLWQSWMSARLSFSTTGHLLKQQVVRLIMNDGKWSILLKNSAK